MPAPVPVHCHIVAFGPDADNERDYIDTGHGRHHSPSLIHGYIYYVYT